MEAVIEKQDALVKAPAIVTKHLFHTRCNPAGSERMAYCGRRFGTSVGEPWYPEQVTPEICVVCLDARETSGCPRCGWKGGL